jgi:uncharacterized membrane protein YqjE
MDTGKISDNFSAITENIKEYIDLRVTLVKLILTEKIAKLASFFLISVIFFILAMFLLLFLSLAFVFWFGEEIGPTYAGALIVTAFYVLVGILIYFMRHRLFYDPLVTKLTKILMEEGEDE